LTEEGVESRLGGNLTKFAAGQTFAGVSACRLPYCEKKEVCMPYFLTEAAYTSEAWSALMRNPHDRLEALRPAVERLGGRIVNAFFAFGEYDVVMILEMPDEASAAALAVAAHGGGSLRTTKTTQLITAAEGVEILKKAATCGYKPVTATAAAAK
jgi:uncharacterized protein with GYD domain